MPKPSSIRTLVSLAVCLLPVLVAGQSATYYRSKDEHGATRYSDRPPQRAGWETLIVSGKTAATAKAPPAPASTTGQRKSSSDALTTADAAAKTRNCDAAKHNLSVLNTNSLLVDSTDIANVKRLSADQRAAALKAAQAEVASSCAAGTS